MSTISYTIFRKYLGHPFGTPDELVTDLSESMNRLYEGSLEFLKVEFIELYRKKSNNNLGLALFKITVTDKHKWYASKLKGNKKLHDALARMETKLIYGIGDPTENYEVVER